MRAVYPLLLAISLASCLPAKSVERSALRASVLSLAQCVRLAALGCSHRMTELDDAGNTQQAIDLGVKCEIGLELAKTSIIAASGAIDASAEGTRIACSIKAATGALGAITKASNATIPALDDALAFAKPFAEMCQ